MRGDWLVLWIMVAAFSIALAVPAAIFGPNLLRGMQERRVLASGQPATGTVVEITETGRRFGIELVPEVTIHFELTAPGRAPWRAAITRIPSGADVAFFIPGRVFEMRYDPARPERVAVMP
ncbi:MAG: hypothetical protein K2X84_03925 [Beijerinckiaceae bacterium]|nr:hypothetical protein [Beijerinckiaceae bacterium]